MCIYRNRSNGCPMLLSMLSKQHEMTDHIYRAGSAAPLQSQRSGGILARVFTHRGRFLQHYLAQGFYGGNFINVPLSLGADWAASAAFWFWVRVSTLQLSVLVKVVSSSPLFAAIILVHPALSHWIIGTSASGHLKLWWFYRILWLERAAPTVPAINLEGTNWNPAWNIVAHRPHGPTAPNGQAWNAASGEEFRVHGAGDEWKDRWQHVGGTYRGSGEESWLVSPLNGLSAIYKWRIVLKCYCKIITMVGKGCGILKTGFPWTHR